MTREEDLSQIQAHVNQLAEHWDSVHIFATRHEAGESDGTVNVQVGAGNWFARYGQIKNWTLIQEARDANSAVKSQNEDEE